jgi:hypothetical protein
VGARAVGVEDDHVGRERAGEVDGGGAVLRVLDVEDDLSPRLDERVGEDLRADDQRALRGRGGRLLRRAADGDVDGLEPGPAVQARALGAARRGHAAGARRGRHADRGFAPGERGHLIEGRAERRDLLGIDLAAVRDRVDPRLLLAEPLGQPGEAQEPGARRERVDPPAQLVAQALRPRVAVELVDEGGELRDAAAQRRDEVRAGPSEPLLRRRGGPRVGGLARVYVHPVHGRCCVKACHRACRNTRPRAPPNLRRSGSSRRRAHPTLLSPSPTRCSTSCQMAALRGGLPVAP